MREFSEGGVWVWEGWGGDQTKERQKLERAAVLEGSEGEERGETGGVRDVSGWQ